MRERWLNAWPANAPLRSRLGWGFTFVHFYVAHPPELPELRWITKAFRNQLRALPDPSTCLTRKKYLSAFSAPLHYRSHGAVQNPRCRHLWH
jgi:hypothetical protein